MERSRQQHLSHYLRLYLLTALVIDLVVSLVYFAFPAYRGLLVDEDRLLETLSALLDLGVFIYALLLITRRAYKGTSRAWLIFLALVGLWSFLEDVSYGQRIFGFDSPRVFGVPIDGMHDFVYVGKRYLDILIKYQARRLLILVVVLGVVMMGLVVKYWSKILAVLGNGFRSPQYLFFIIYVLLMAPSAILDLDVFSSPLTTLIEEVFEFDASLALLFGCIAIDGISRHKGSLEPESGVLRTAR